MGVHSDSSSCYNRKVLKPLNSSAVEAANTAQPTCSNYAERKNWMDKYIEAGGAWECVCPKGQKPKDPKPPCPLCGKAHLIVKVINDIGNPVEGTTVNVDTIGGSFTTAEGLADYGQVEPGTYSITGEKERTSSGPGDPGGLATDSVTVHPDETKLAVLKLCSKCLYWNENHRTDYNGPDSKFLTSTQISSVNVAFRLEANLADGNITITSIFRWGTVASDVTNAQKADTIKKFKAQVASWGNKFNMKIIDPICGEKTLPVRFRLIWSPEDTSTTAPFQVNLYKTYPRAGVTGWNIDIGYDSDVTPDSSWVLAHEYGHSLCLQDEYFYSGVSSATVTYKKADGTSDVISLEPSSGNIMYTHANTTYLKRFYYFTAIEAQELLCNESGRSVTCEIVN